MEITIHEPMWICELGKRRNQEDSIYPKAGQATTQARCLVLCDGMGGLDAGEVASAVVSEQIGRHVEQALASGHDFTDEDFEKALGHAYDQLDRAADKDAATTMGTTLALLCFHRGGCLAAHIGDSRIYHFRPSTGEVLYRSRDHSLVYQLFEQGEITLDEMRTSPQRHIILRAMQPHQKSRTVADVVHIRDVAAGDYFMIGSDGMFENIDDQTLVSLFQTADTDEQKCQRLKTLSAQGRDNHSAYMVRVESVMHTSGDDDYPDDEREARDANKVLEAELAEEEVTIVAASKATATPATHEEAAQPNMQPVQLGHRGRKLSLAIVILAVVAIIVALIILLLGK